MKSTFLLAVVAVLFSSVDAQFCPCGSTGSNCTELVSGFTSSLEESCTTFDDEATCVAGAKGKPECSCPRGVKGDLCDEEIQAQSFNYALGFAFVILLCAISAYLIRKHKNATDFEEFQRPSLIAAAPRRSGVSQGGLFAFRFIVLIWCLATQIYNDVDKSSRADDKLLSLHYTYRTYTIWNFLLIIALMSVGAYISIQVLRGKLPDQESMTTVQRVHNIMWEIAMSSGILVSIVTWGLLLPPRLNDGRAYLPGGILGYASFMQHLVNIALLVGEASMSKVFFVKQHVYFLVFWPTIYGFFHTCLMLARESSGERHIPVYPFLSMEPSIFIIWLFGLIVAHVLFFKMCSFVHYKLTSGGSGEKKMGQLENVVPEENSAKTSF